MDGDDRLNATVCERSSAIGRINARRSAGVREDSALALTLPEKRGAQRQHIGQEGGDMQPTINRGNLPGPWHWVCWTHRFKPD